MNATVATALQAARRLAASGDDEAAKQCYLDVLRRDPDNAVALVEIAVLAETSGHRSAARSAYRRAIRSDPANAAAQAGLGTLALRDDDLAAARQHYQAALAADPGFAPAQQGLARVLTALGDPSAEAHWQAGFTGHAVVPQRYRGEGEGIPLLLLVAARGGNIPTRYWIDGTVFAVTAVFADYHDPADPLPCHALTVNAIGDADLCATALAKAERLVADDRAPLINHPGRVRLTGRLDNARRLDGVPGVVTPRVVPLTRSTDPAEIGLPFPVLLRAPGFHTGQHFLRVGTQEALAAAAAAMPGDDLLAIEYLDARGADGLARKYRVMFIDGTAYPLHLAISRDWKVHYFTAGMAGRAALREEERRFLEDMPGVLGGRAMEALAGIQATLGLAYAGVDFGLAADGSLLLFEANATMVINPPDPDAVWDYRRPAVDAAVGAARTMLTRYASMGAMARAACRC
jgi:hypothetical protein